MIGTVLFDAVGTLIYPHPAVADVYQAAGRRYGSRRSRAQIAARFRVALARHHPSGHPPRPPAIHTGGSTSIQGERRRWRRIIADVFDDVAERGPLFEELWEHFARAGSWRTFADVQPTWQRLRREGYRLGIASNFDDRLDAIRRQLPPLIDADYVFHSAGIGYAKPDRRFYGQVACRVGSSPEEILLVGDDREHDYLAARAAGFAALWLRRDPGPEPLGDNSIESLEQVVDWLR